MSKAIKTVVWMLILSTANLFAPARAALIGTEQAVIHTQAGSERDRVNAFLNRAEVQAELQKYGVSPEDAKARVVAMTDKEVHTLAQRLDTLPAGGDIIGALLTVFIVLLITDILGFTKVFSFTRPIK